MATDTFLWEKRILLLAFGAGILSSLLFLVAFSSEFWVYVSLYKPQSRSDERGEFLKVGHYHGLWKICRQELWYFNKTASNDTYDNLYCRAMFFTLPPSITEPKRRDLEWQMLHFRRSTVVIGFIALLLSAVAHGFCWYSLAQLRYIFKRLAGCLQLITAACSWVTLEVFRQSIKFEETNMQHNVPEFSQVQHGWSFNLVWISLVLFLFPGVVFLVFSRKRKGRKARSMKEAHENEPVHLGRI